MPITSVKSVNLIVRFSRVALSFHIASLLIVLWAILASFVPLTATVWLLVYLSPHFYPEKHIFTGLVTIQSDGTVLTGNSKGRISYSICFYSALALLLKTEQGKSLLIWRDGCNEAEYRQLKQFLEQIDRQKKSDRNRSLNG